MKKTLSFLLAVVMIMSIFSCLTITASAASVTSITYKAAEKEVVYEEVDGYWSSVYDGPSYFRYNFGYVYKEGNVITLNYSDGKKVPYTYKNGSEGWEYYSASGAILGDISVTSDQYDNHWYLGTNYYTLTYDSWTTKVPVEVIPNPVASIKFTPAAKIVLAEEDDDIGDWQEKYDGGKYFRYDVYNIVNKGGNKITVNYTNGKTTVFTYSNTEWGYYDAKGNEIDTSHLTREDTQYDNPWVYGTDASFNVIYMGRVATVPVTISRGKPAQPTGLKVVNGESGVVFTWNHSQGASGYRIYRKVAGQKNWSYVKTVDDNMYKDYDVKNGNNYRYTVRATNANGLSAYNKTGLSIKHIYSPYIKSVENVSNGIKVQWYSVSNVSGYKVYRKAGNETSWKYIGKTTGTAITDKNVKSGTKYTYTVRAYKGNTLSGYDEDGMLIKRLNNPGSIKAKSYASGIKVTWNKVTGATGYYVYRKVGSGGWKKIATVKGQTKVSYIDKSAKKGTTYKYTVKAYSGKQVSAFNAGATCKDKY